MNKGLWVTLLVVLLAGVAYDCYRLGLLPIAPKAVSSTSTTLLLEDTPVHYCPAQAEIVLTRQNNIVADSRVALTNCRQLSLSRFLPNDSVTTVFVKLPEALA